MRPNLTVADNTLVTDFKHAMRWMSIDLSTFRQRLASSRHQLQIARNDLAFADAMRLDRAKSAARHAIIDALSNIKLDANACERQLARIKRLRIKKRMAI